MACRTRSVTRVRMVHLVGIVVMTAGLTGASCVTYYPAGPETRPAATQTPIRQEPVTPATEPERPLNLKHQVDLSDSARINIVRVESRGFRFD